MSKVTELEGLLQLKNDALLKLKNEKSLLINHLKNDGNEDNADKILEQNEKSQQIMVAIDQINQQIKQLNSEIDERAQIVADILSLKVDRLPKGEKQFENLFNLSSQIKTKLDLIIALNSQAVELTTKSLNKTEKLLKKNKNDQRLNNCYSPVSKLQSGVFLDIKE